MARILTDIKKFSFEFQKLQTFTIIQFYGIETKFNQIIGIKNQARERFENWCL